MTANGGQDEIDTEAVQKYISINVLDVLCVILYTGFAAYLFFY